MGAVVATLEEERLIDSTYIFYSSDQCVPLSSLLYPPYAFTSMVVLVPVLMLALAAR